MDPDSITLMQLLAEAEKKIINTKKNTDNVNTYYQFDEWYIKESFLRKKFQLKNFFSPEIIPGINSLYYPSIIFKRSSKITNAAKYKDKGNALGVFLGRLFTKKIQASTQADILYISKKKSHRIRSMYFLEGQQLSIKLGVGPKNVNKIKNEIETINYINSKKIEVENVFIPRIANFHISKNLVYFSDNLISGNEISSNNNDIFYRILNFMKHLYLVYGIIPKKTKDVFALNKMKNNLWKVLETINLKTLKIDKNSFYKKGISFLNKTSEKLILCSLVHGDLKLENIILDKSDCIHIIDWEKACTRPIMKDLASIYNEFPDMQKIIIKFYNENFGGFSNAASFKEQLLLHQFKKINTSKKIKHLNNLIANINKLFLTV